MDIETPKLKEQNTADRSDLSALYYYGLRLLRLRAQSQRAQLRISLYLYILYYGRQNITQ